MVCFIDFETTGIDLFNDHPIELGAVLVNDNFEIINEFHSYISLEKSVKINEDVFKIHGIDNDFLIDKPSSNEVIEEFFEKFGTDYRLAGWNISFDAGFLKKMAHLNSMTSVFNKINYRHLDIQSIAALYGYYLTGQWQDSSLDTLLELFKLKRSKYHGALEDAKLTLKVFKNILGDPKNVVSPIGNL